MKTHTSWEKEGQEGTIADKLMREPHQEEIVQGSEKLKGVNLYNYGSTRAL